MVSLILPAVQSARDHARGITCKNNLKQLSLGVLSYAETERELPEATLWVEGDHGSAWPKKNWAISILPYIEQRGIADQWDSNKPANSGKNGKLVQTRVSIFVCPADISDTGGADQSYGVNAGPANWRWVGARECYEVVAADSTKMDLNGDGRMCNAVTAVGAENESDLDVLHKLRVFPTLSRHSVRSKQTGRNWHHRIQTVTDGLSNTLMLVENLRIGVDPLRYGSGWGSCEVIDVGVHFGHEVCAQGNCGSGADWNAANSELAAINAGRSAPEGRSPWASSYHNGGVNVAFCDGSVRFVAESIAGRVYAGFFSPQGARIQGPLFH